MGGYGGRGESDTWEHNITNVYFKSALKTKYPID